MRITGTGHASMRIDTAAGSILCDPWVNPAYFASWFPFPDNSQLDWETLGQVDYGVEVVSTNGQPTRFDFTDFAITEVRR